MPQSCSAMNPNPFHICMEGVLPLGKGIKSSRPPRSDLNYNMEKMWKKKKKDAFLRLFLLQLPPIVLRGVCLSLNLKEVFLASRLGKLKLHVISQLTAY